MVFLFDEQYLALAGDTLSLERKVKEKDERIKKLEELLKECKNLINECIRGDYKNELCERIDEALK